MASQNVNLDELENEQHTVQLRGAVHKVRPVTGRIANVVAAAAAAEGDDRMRLYYDAVALMVPTMGRADVEDLSLKQLTKIMELSGTQVDAVEAAANPNAESPAPEPTATPTSGESVVTS